MLSIFCSPLRYVQGKGAFKVLGEELAYLGIKGPILAVSGKTGLQLFMDHCQDSLKDAKIAFESFLFSRECTVEEINKIEDQAKKIGAEAIIGVGGGKSIDAARAAAEQAMIPFISCPTLASTDAPCSAISVIYTETGEFSKALFHTRNPLLVLVDTEIIAQSPPRTLISGMGDAVSKLFEGMACIEAGKPNCRGGKATDTAASLAQLCYKQLLELGEDAVAAIKSHSITPALERVIETNILISGLSFESCGLAAAHGVHNGITQSMTTHRALHGEKVAFGLLVQLVLEKKPQKIIDEVLNFYKRVGLPTNFKGIDVENPDQAFLEKVAIATLEKDDLIHNEPFPVTKDSLIDALKVANTLSP